jgi:DNA ligase-4
MQIHYSQKDDKLTIFSKSGRNSTEDRINSHDIIRTCLGIPNKFSAKSAIVRNDYLTHVDECIIECELLVYNNEKGIERFGGVSDFRNLFGKGLTNTENRHYCLAFFDILLLNNLTLLIAPFQERRNYLKNTIQPIKNYVFYILTLRHSSLKYSVLKSHEI